MSSERRLHPLTLLFELGRGLRELAVPMIVLIFVSRSGNANLIGPAALLLLTGVIAAARYLSFSYRYEPSELVIRSGIVVRKERHIPYERIQNIDAVQNVAHRALGVVAVQVQTGAGAAPEATLSVLPLSALAEMRERVFRARIVPGAAVGAEMAPGTAAPLPAAAAPAGRTLLELSSEELMLAGFIENRGLVLVAGAVGLVSQVDPLRDGFASWLEAWIPGIDWRGVFGESPLTDPRVIAAALVAVVAILVFIRILSTLWAVIRLNGFRVTRLDDDLRVEYGMFTRVTATIPLRRIQTIAVHETLLHRRLKRAALRVTTAGGGTGTAGRAEREWLAPIVRREAVEALLHELHPGVDLGTIAWRKSHPRAFARLARRSSALALGIGGVSALLVGEWAIPITLILIIRAVVRSRIHIANLAWGSTHDGVIFRGGWLRRVTTVARYSRIQAAELVESPFDRRTAMAHVVVDTAAAGLGMPYLAREDAVELRDLVVARAAGTAFAW